MSPLATTSTSHYSTETSLPAGMTRESALSFLHDHETMIRLNPYTVAVVPEARFSEEEAALAKRLCEEGGEEQGQEWYRVTDAITHLPRGIDRVSFFCCFRDVHDGVVTRCWAPLGVQIRTKWSIQPDEGGDKDESQLQKRHGRLRVREDVQLTCHALLRHFVKMSMRKSHLVLIQKFGELQN